MKQALYLITAGIIILMFYTLYAQKVQCKPPRKEYNGECLYQEEIDKREAAEAEKRKKAAAAAARKRNLPQHLTKGNMCSDVNFSSPCWLKAENTDCYLWNSEPESIKKISYQGVCKNGFAHGKGKSTSHFRKDFSKYEYVEIKTEYSGGWVSGKREGKGNSHFDFEVVSFNLDGIWGARDSFKGNMSYSGEWNKGKKQGFGSITIKTDASASTGSNPDDSAVQIVRERNTLSNDAGEWENGELVSYEKWVVETRLADLLSDENGKEIHKKADELKKDKHRNKNDFFRIDINSAPKWVLGSSGEEVGRCFVGSFAGLKYVNPQKARMFSDSAAKAELVRIFFIKDTKEKRLLEQYNPTKEIYDNSSVETSGQTVTSINVLSNTASLYGKLGMVSNKEWISGNTIFTQLCIPKQLSKNVVPFPHRHAGLRWSNPAPNRMNHSAAIKYCKDLGGRLPTISELRTLIKNCPSTQTGGACKVTDSCLSSSCWKSACNGCSLNNSGKYSIFKDAGGVWSSSVRSDATDYAWSAAFIYGGVRNDYRSNSLNVRCVQ
jgi:hypothetical protein